VGSICRWCGDLYLLINQEGPDLERRKIEFKAQHAQELAKQQSESQPQNEVIAIRVIYSMY